MSKQTQDVGHEKERAKGKESIMEDGGVHNVSSKNRGSSEEGSTSLWLITFTDIMALMLTFFVLLYSMSVPAEEEWEEITTGLSRHFDQYESPQWYEGPQDEIDIARIDFKKALNLKYLQSIVLQTLSRDERLNKVVVFPQPENLVISVPEELLFKPGQAEVSLAGKQALFAIGGAVSNIRNRIEVVGHTDPRPVSPKKDGAAIESNWELSLRRAISVANILKSVGYDRPVITRGLSSARYDELGEAEEQQRLDLSRRVDILIMQDDGSERKVFTIMDK